MANLVVSSVCNQQCPYCFAKDYFQTTQAGENSHFISMDAFETHLDFLERSGINEIRLIGGEPTLHPQFPELIRRARARSKRILVFTNGLLPARVVDCLSALSPEECTILVNTNTSGKTGNAQLRADAIRTLGPRVLLGFNIHEVGFDLNPIFDLILKNNCRKAIRLGLAQPTLAGRTKFLNVKQYKSVGHRIAEFAEQAAQEGIALEFDCGFVHCMFSEEELQTLHQTGADIGWRCNPILDVDMDGTVFHCFPLASRVFAPLTNETNATELRAQLAKQIEPFRAAGIYKDCSSCASKQSGECTGGCMANTLRRFQRADFEIEMTTSKSRNPHVLLAEATNPK